MVCPDCTDLVSQSVQVILNFFSFFFFILRALFKCNGFITIRILNIDQNLEIIVAFLLQYAHYVCVWAKCKVPEVLLHIPALTLVPLVQKPQDALLKRLGTLILRKLQGERREAGYTEKQHHYLSITEVLYSSHLVLYCKTS